MNETLPLTESERQPLLLIDGHSLAFRAFFALPDSIATADGRPTNALYGLAAMMLKVVTELRPGRVVVCWDSPGGTFRHALDPEYKGTRASTPDLFREQEPQFVPLMGAFGFANTALPGFEADDIIGTLAERAQADGEPVVILTGDRDAFQLVSDLVSVMATGRGVTDTTLYTPDAVRDRYGIGPELMVDFRGMVGDPSDNLKGVPGIGEKGAATLLQRYGSLDAILDHADEQTPKRRQALTEHADTARRTREMALIVRDAPVELDLATVAPLRFDSERVAALRQMFAELQFETLSRRLGELAEAAGAAPGTIPSAGRILPVELSEVDPQDLAMRLAGADLVAVAIGNSRWALAPGGDQVLVGPIGDGGVEALVAALSAVRVACHDAKAVVLRTEGRVEPAHDIMVAAYLLEPRRRGYSLDELAADLDTDVAEGIDGVAREARLVADLAARQVPALDEGGMHRLYHMIELPVTRVLAAMERAGILLDTARLARTREHVQQSIAELRGQIWEHAGEQFTVESPKQLGRILFEVLGLPTFRKGKTGWSTDRRVLRMLEDRHPIVPLVGRYRELTKLESTYLATLPGEVAADGRIHTTFNQTVAETGRLSSVNPNLQNIPVRTELGREIRDAFRAPEGGLLLSCDYSQVELRILAHCSGEPALARAFRAGEDVHRATAAEVFGMPLEEVDRTTRERAKAVNFGIIYGISDFGLSEQLGISRSDARTYIDQYLDRYPRVRGFVEETIATAKDQGYVTTLLGRRRPIPELGGRTAQQRQLGERLAVNTVIQGTAADIIKLAMIEAHRALQASGMAARLILQLHDELLIETAEQDAERVADTVREAMVGAYRLDPPLVVDTGMGVTWREAKA